MPDDGQNQELTVDLGEIDGSFALVISGFGSRAEAQTFADRLVAAESDDETPLTWESLH